MTINNLLPGSFETDRFRATPPTPARRPQARRLEETLQAIRKAIPAGRVGVPAEFGAACAFLCSAQAGYIVGQNILIDGGAYPGTF